MIMKNSIVADGPMRFAESKEYQERRSGLQRAVAAKYAAELSEAGFFRRLYIRYLRQQEFQRELDKITPSPQSSWFGLLASRDLRSNGKAKTARSRTNSA